jgi:hypothetical protein
MLPDVASTKWHENGTARFLLITALSVEFAAAG